MSRSAYFAQVYLEGSRNRYHTHSGFPKRAGVAWSKYEDSILLKAVELGFDQERIAKGHQRTEGAINSRLAHHANDAIPNYNKGIKPWLVLEEDK